MPEPRAVRPRRRTSAHSCTMDGIWLLFNVREEFNLCHDRASACLYPSPIIPGRLRVPSWLVATIAQRKLIVSSLRFLHEG